MDSYASIKALNWSKLKLLERSPRHFKEYKGEETDSMRLGTAAHCAVLEPARFQRDFVVYPGKVRRGKEWESFEFQACAEGKTVLSRSEHEDACSIRDAVRGDPPAMKYLSQGQAEQNVIWNIDGRPCKGRFDYIGPLAIADLKTAQCSSPEEFVRAAIKYGYAGQAAWYHDGWIAAGGAPLSFKIIAVESSEPHIVTVFNLPAAVIEFGRAQYKALLQKLEFCENFDIWNGYADGEVDMVLK